MKKICKTIKRLEDKLEEIDTNQEEREVMRTKRLHDEAVLNRDRKNELKQEVLHRLEYWNEVKEKYAELPQEEEGPEDE